MPISDSLRNSLRSITRSTEDSVEMQGLLDQIGTSTGPKIWSAAKSSLQAVPGGFAQTQVMLTTSIVNDDSLMTSDGVFVGTEAGLYEITATVFCSGQNAAEGGSILVFSDTLGGAAAGSRIATANADGNSTTTVSGLVQMTANTTLTLSIRPSNAVTVEPAGFGPEDRTQLTVKKLR